MTAINKLTPRIVVDDAANAIRYYTKVFGADEIGRYEVGGKIVHAELTLGGSVLMIKDADDIDPAPRQVGGSPVLLAIDVDDVDATAQRMLDAGATIVFDVDDREYGQRDGRIRDPFGHLWILSQPLSA